MTEGESEEPVELTAAEKERLAKLIDAATSDIKLGEVEAAKPDANEKAKAAAKAAGTPVWFAMVVLGLTMLHRWQAIALTWFENTKELVKASLCTPNGAGKSAFVDAPLALWWITAHPQGRVVITTKDSKQLDNQIWPAIERHKAKFPKYDFIERMVRNGTGGFIIGFTTDDPGRAEGWHKLNDTTGPLLIIGDEAKSIADGIHMALDRCTYNAKLLTSSPGLTEGLFYESQTKLAGPMFVGDKFTGMGGGGENGFRAMRVGLKDCPHIPKSRIQNIIDTYGPDHWFTRSTLHAEFTDNDSETLFVIPKHIVRTLMDNPPPYVPGGKRAFCDFAAGRNENVFAFKQGNRIEITAWKDPDTMRAVNQFIALFVEKGLIPSEIYGDAGGMGIPIIHRFNQLDWPINPVNNESAAIDDLRYPNVGAESWHNAAVKLARGDIILPNDPVLFDQLTQRRAAPTSKAILGLEKKKDMQKRGVESPDRADAVVGVLATDTELGNTVFDREGLEKLEADARLLRRPEIGLLELTGERISYQARSDGWLNVFERPVVGASYVLVLNPHRFEEQLQNHSLLVVRAPRWNEETKKDEPARLVARVRQTPFRLDAKPLAHMVAKVSGWYGKAIVIPIVNDRGDVIDALVDEGLHLYGRQEFEVHRKGRKRQFKYGWETNAFSQSLWQGALAEAIREDQLTCEDIAVVTQLYQLNPRSPSACREAESLGVALKEIGYATEYCAPSTRFIASEDSVSQYG